MLRKIFDIGGMEVNIGGYNIKIRNRSNRILRSENRRNSVLFFETPRCGSGSIVKLCREVNVETHGHNRRGNYTFLRDRADLKEKFVFTVVRNPIDRFVSAFKWLSGGGENEMDRQEMEKFQVNTLEINEFVDRWIFDESPLFQQAHFTPMVDYLTDDSELLIPDLIIEYEALSRSERVILNLIGSRRGALPFVHKTSLGEQRLSENSKARLYKYYRKDFECFYPEIRLV